MNLSNSSSDDSVEKVIKMALCHELPSDPRNKMDAGLDKMAVPEIRSPTNHMGEIHLVEKHSCF